jgi:hypothetical protein
MNPLEQRDKGSEPDREGRQKNVPGDDPGELQTGKDDRI